MTWGKPIIGLERLTALDVCRLVDWTREAWRDNEWSMTARLDHLRRTVDQLEEPYRARALEAHRILEEARISNGRPWQAALEQIKLAALDWERSRPPLVPCGIGRCAIRYRHPEALLRHRALVHGT